MTSIGKVPSRIILSRKGFDSSAGGCPSPIVNEQMISLPIPEHSKPPKDRSICNDGHQRYGDLRAQNDLDIADLVLRSSGMRITRTDCVHLDPDIRRDLRAEQHFSLPLTFGQCSSSQSHLQNQGVTEGDLFLFFGWFKRESKNGGVASLLERERDMHLIWGWLQIGELLKLPNELERARDIAGHHPHLKYGRGKEPNCLYVAKDELTFMPMIKGAGVFASFREEIRLTEQGAQLKSQWRLPNFIQKTGMTYHPRLDSWTTEGEFIRGKGGAGRGQEFVIETLGQEAKATLWLKDIFGGIS